MNPVYHPCIHDTTGDFTVLGDYTELYGAASCGIFGCEESSHSTATITQVVDNKGSPHLPLLIII